MQANCGRVYPILAKVMISWLLFFSLYKATKHYLSIHTLLSRNELSTIPDNECSFFTVLFSFIIFLCRIISSGRLFFGSVCLPVLIFFVCLLEELRSTFLLTSHTNLQEGVGSLDRENKKRNVQRKVTVQ